VNDPFMRTLLFCLLLGFATFYSHATSQIEGQWMTDCSFVPRKHSGILSLRLQSDAYSVLFSQYSDRECNVLGFEIAQSGTYERSGEDFDHTLTSIVMTLQSEDVVKHSNQTLFCGYSDWKIGESRDISGRRCGPFAMPIVGKKSFDLLRLKDGGLTFGGFPRENTFESPTLRPKQTNTDWVFRQQE
jgi:hypothetical protein